MAVLPAEAISGLLDGKETIDLRINAAALGSLRFELINNFGTPITRGLLLRLGYRSGKNAALTSNSSPKKHKSGINACRRGLVRALNRMGIRYQCENGSGLKPGNSPSNTLLAGTVHDSPEARSHLEYCGSSPESACWLTSGFITGLVEASFGKEVICVETGCRAAGAPYCRFEVRGAEGWGEIGKDLRATLVEQPPMEQFNCGQDHQACKVHQALQFQPDPVLGNQIEACMQQVERFGQHLQMTVDRKVMELRKRDDFLANILKDSADGIITVDVNDCIISWNKGAENIYGYTQEEALGKNIEMLLPMENQRSRELEIIRRKLEKEGVVRNFKTQRVTKSGRKIEIILTRTAIRGESGDYIGSSAIVKDVTQLRSIENQLSRAEHLATMGELAASLAHEIKNPLAGIKGAIEVILDQFDGQALHRQVLGEVMQEVKRIDRIVQDLLGYARPRDPRFGNIRLRELFRRVALLFDRTIEEKRIRFDLLVDPDADSVYADENLLEQVLLNLILNSLQALGENGTLVLSTRLTRDTKGVEITVQDNGPGIAPENISRVFQPFFTTKKDGTGLGLATCKRIITDHGGTLTVASVPGMGATFRIWLPAGRFEGIEEGSDRAIERPLC